MCVHKGMHLHRRFIRDNCVFPLHGESNEQSNTFLDKWYDRLEIRPGRILRVVSLNNLNTHRNRNNGIVVDNVMNNQTLDVASISSNSNRKYFFQEREMNNRLDILDDYNNSDAVKDTLIFFIHGVGGCSDVWKAQMLYFQKAGYGVLAPDLIGHGFSNTPRAKSYYEFSEICQDLLELFDRSYRTMNVVVGHSYGGSFATVVAHERPHLVQTLVLVSGGSPTPLAPQIGIFSLPTCMLCCCLSIIKKSFYQ